MQRVGVTLGRKLSTIKLRLPEIRRRRRLTQRQLAAGAGLRPDTISALERGQTGAIHFETLARLCEVLNCDPGICLRWCTTRVVPVLGGPDEDDIIRQRLGETTPRVDGPSFLAELMQVAEAERPVEGSRR
ncbi:MAG: helix-turn-helix domain-containing protein [Chloroflexia bacterium]